jgi:hypothetical protein
MVSIKIKYRYRYLSNFKTGANGSHYLAATEVIYG